MNMIYMVGYLVRDFEGGTTTKGCIKVKRNIGKQYDYFDVVAFKEVAEDCKKIKGDSKVAIEGTLQKSKFGETWYYTIVINDIKLLEKPQPKDPVNTDIQEQPNKVGEMKKIVKDIVDLQNDNTPTPNDDVNLNDTLDLPDDDLPF